MKTKEVHQAFVEEIGVGAGVSYFRARCHATGIESFPFAFTDTVVQREARPVPADPIERARFYLDEKCTDAEHSI